MLVGDDGHPIMWSSQCHGTRHHQAHGGSIILHQGVYYWYGEYKDGLTTKDSSSGYGWCICIPRDVHNAIRQACARGCGGHCLLFI